MSSSGLPQSIRHCSWREPREGGTKRKRRVVYSFQYSCHGKRRGIKGSDTQQITSAQATCRVPRHRYTECTKTFLGFLAVRLSSSEPKKCYGRIGTSIQEFKHEEPKRQEKTLVSLSIDPLAIATARIAGLETKRRTSKRGSIHILLDRRELRTREENKITLFQPTHHGTNDSWRNKHDPMNYTNS